MGNLELEWCHETSLSADLRSPARARAFVVRHLVEHRRTTLVDPVRLVASELVTNAVEHARTGFTVTLSEWDAVVTLSVEDQQASRLPAIGTLPALAERGRGLRIVDRFSDRWGVSTDPRGAKLVWASFSL